MKRKLIKISSLHWVVLVNFILISLPCSLFTQSLFFSNANPQGILIGDLDIPGNQLTVEALAAWQGGGNIVSKHGSPSDVNYLLRAGRFELTTYINGSSGPTRFKAVTYDSLSSNTIYHFAATYDGSNIRYYVDGCMVKEEPFSGNMYQNNKTTVIGNRSDCFTIGICEQWTGFIDEVRIWNVCRSPDQIKENMYDLPNPQSQTGLRAYYKFNNNALNSAGTNQWNGTVVGSVTYTQEDIPFESFRIDSVVVADASCRETEDGSISIYTNMPNCLYSIDGVNFQQLNQFQNLSSGTYQILVQTPRGCIENSVAVVNHTREYIDVEQYVSICEGSEYLGYRQSGVYVDTLSTADACDTIRTLFLSVNANVPTTSNLVLCPSEVVQYGGITISAPGNYELTLQDMDGCDSIVFVNVSYVTNQFLQDEIHVCDGEAVILKSPSDSTMWSDNSVSQSMVVTRPGIYFGAYTDDNGCIIEDSTNVFFHSRAYIPNVFSPNNDGYNDCFRVYFDDVEITEFQISIYNRAGGLVYQSSDPYECWDGKMNGKDCGQGTYAYYLSWKSDSCQMSTRKGSVTIAQ